METKDIIGELVAQLSKTIEFDELEAIVDTDIWRINPKCTYWLMIGDVITIQDEKFTIVAINDEGVFIEPYNPSFVLVPPFSFELEAPTYFNGTYKMVKNEVNAVPDKDSFIPMVWLLEVIDDNVTNDTESMIDRSSDIRMFFVAAADYDNWLTNDHYDKVIYPMATMVEEFLDLIRDNRFFTDVFDYRKRNLVNISVGGEQIESIFDLNLTGIELRIFSDIRKDLYCTNNC